MKILINKFYLVQHFCPNIPCVLVGTKSDLRKSAWDAFEYRQDSAVSFAEGCQLAQQINAFKYVECSSLEFQGLKVGYLLFS